MNFWDREKWEHTILHFTFIIKALVVEEDKNTHRLMHMHATAYM